MSWRALVTEYTRGPFVDADVGMLLAHMLCFQNSPLGQVRLHLFIFVLRLHRVGQDLRQDVLRDGALPAGGESDRAQPCVACSPGQLLFFSRVESADELQAQHNPDSKRTQSSDSVFRCDGGISTACVSMLERGPLGGPGRGRGLLRRGELRGRGGLRNRGAALRRLRARDVVQPGPVTRWH